MNYKSTRGGVSGIGFIDAVLMGLADDGGLLVPETIPQIGRETLEEWRSLRYPELALEVLTLFVGDEIPRSELKELIDASYASFRDPEVTPLTRIRDDLAVLELFHGPTFAFKDVALQFLGQLYAYISRRTGSVIHILGATSGDTGASAIEGVRGKDGIRICILHPHGKVSRVQELQMTTVNADNVLNLAVDGTFDDCQRIIKELFADVEFKRRYHLRAINSINIARLLAQTVYYFYAVLRLESAGVSKPRFSVPTGNFGDIFAGYLAGRMGLPMGKLILATNENNILERFVQDGVYRPGEFRGTYSPSMDIQVASNFERFLYYLEQEDPAATAVWMERLGEDGEIAIPADQLAKVQDVFDAYGVKNPECLDAIRTCFEATGYLLDPHTACGVAAAERLAKDASVVALATAHPAKFDESIRLTGIEQAFPAAISALFEQLSRVTRVGGSTEAVKAELLSFF
jgi:threonine synthase